MPISKLTSDKAVLAELGERLSRTRLERNLSQEQLAYRAGVSKRTVERIESGAATNLSGFIRVLRALDLLDRLDSAVPEPLPSPIEQLKLSGRRRRRAGRHPESSSPDAWTWGPPPTGDAA